jgi:predicted nucleic acid-binding protein
MRSIAILDTGPLLAVADEDDRNHVRCVALLQRSDIRLVIPAMVVAETTYFIEKRGGPVAEARFLRGLSSYEVEAPHAEDWLRIAALVEQYADFPLGGTDASIIALAERLNTDVVITLDRRHFGAVRPLHVPSLRLLPPDDQANH